MNPIKYSDLITPEGEDTIQRAINELTELINTFQSARQTIISSANQTAQGMQGLSGATGEQREQIALLSQKVAELESQLKELNTLEQNAKKTRSQLTQAEKDAIQLKKLEKDAINAAKGSYNALSAEYRKTLIELRQLGDEEKKQGTRYKDLQAKAKNLRGEMSKFNKDIGEYRMEVGHYQNALSALPPSLQKLGRAFTSWQGLAVAAIGAVTAAITLLTKAFKSVVSINKDFEQANANLAAILGKQNNEIGLLTETALSLGRATEWTASQVTQLQTELAKLGFGEGSIIAMQKYVLAFATAVGADLGEAATMAGAAIRAFNLTSQDAERVMGTLAVGINKSALSFDRVKYAMGTVFPIANAFGLEIEDATALLGALANAGFSAESAATATRNMLLNLADANGKLAKRTGGAAKSFDDIIDKLVQLRKEGADLSEIFELTDKRSVAAFNALMTGTETAKELRQALDEVNGELERIQRQRLDTVQGQTTILKSKWQDLKLAFRESNGWIKEMVINLQKVVDITKQGLFPRQAAEQEALDEFTDSFRGMYSKNGAEMTEQYITDVVHYYEKELNKLEQSENRNSKKTKERIELLTAKIAGIKKAAAIVREQIINDQDELARQAELKREEDENRQKELTKAQKQQRLKDLQAKVDEAKYEVSIAEKGTEQIYKARVKLAEAERDLDMEKNRQAEATAKRDVKIINEKWDEELKIAKRTTDRERAQIDIKRLQDEQTLIQNEIAITKEGTEEMLALRIANLDKQEEIEKEQLKNREDYYKMSEEQIQKALDSITEKYKTKRLQEDAKFWVTMANRELKARQDIAEAVFRQEAHTEREKSMFKLEQEKFRLEAILETNKTAAEKMTDLEVEAVTETIKAIEAEMGRLPYDNIYDLIGLKMTDEQRKALEDVWGVVKDQLQSVIDAYKDAADEARNSADKQVDAAQRVLEAEIEARNNGYAHSVETAQKELAMAKENQKKAVKMQQEAKEAQLNLDAITQVSSLTTATANIWKAFGGIPYVGPALAIAAIATMWTSFIGSQMKARSLAKQEFGEGTVELLEGGSHASGNDIDLGYDKRTRKHRRAEGGEFFAVINKRESRRHRNLIPDVINSLNDGTFTQKYQRANDALGGIIIQSGTDVSRLEKDVHAIKKQGEEMRFVDNAGRVVVKYKNLTTIKK